MLTLLGSSGALVAQTPTLQWQRCLGGTAEDDATSIIQTADGGCAVATIAYSPDGVGCGYEGDGWLVKLLPDGSVDWSYCSGYEWIDTFSSVAQCSDGGYILTGSLGVYPKVRVVRLSSTGTLMWEHLFGTISGSTKGIEAQQTDDGGFIVLGDADGNDGDVSGNHGLQDAWLFKLNSSGDLVWQSCIGTSGFEYPNDLVAVADGGYLIAGTIYGADTLGCSGLATSDGWVVRVDPLG
ncbi:MAG TPA: hypothetical protein VKG92_08600, partial [Flavobacteriales bacterium]|nr:hypothetical protein [Flavobacteriales bacterium]